MKKDTREAWIGFVFVLVIGGIFLAAYIDGANDKPVDTTALERQQCRELGADWVWNPATENCDFKPQPKAVPTYEPTYEAPPTVAPTTTDDAPPIDTYEPTDTYVPTPDVDHHDDDHWSCSWRLRCRPHL